MACKKKFKYLPFPIWSLCLYKNWVLLSGGGGGKKFGIKNKLMLYKPYTMEILKELDTGEELVVSLISISTKDLIISGIGKDIAIYKITNNLEINSLARFPCDLTKNVGKIRSFSQEKMLISGGEEGIIRI